MENATYHPASNEHSLDARQALQGNRDSDRAEWRGREEQQHASS